MLVRLPSVPSPLPPLLPLPVTMRACGVWRRVFVAFVAGLAMSGSSAPLAAQSVPPAALPLPGSEAEAVMRLHQLLGQESADGMMLRTVGNRIEALRSGRDTVVLFGAEGLYSYNSAHPWGFNDGPLRAGRGANFLVRAGFAARRARLTVVVIPQVIRESNTEFQTIPWPQPNSPTRNVWANPFYPLPTSLDMPQRFGDQPRNEVRLQGRVALDVTRALRVGAGNENRWWGPGVRNGLLLSANAGGFPHLFLEAPAPIETKIGNWEYQYLLGRLDESELFDFDDTNNGRSFSAAAVTWQAPERFGEWPVIGVSRAVMSRTGPGLATALDFLRDVGRPWSRTADSISGRDQITTLFTRWRFPTQGAEAYAEWARYEQPASVREFMEQPGHMQGYTVGAQWARPWRTGTLQFQSELSYLEPSASVRYRPIGTTYTSPSVPQGWTHDGQMIGPSIGPGASSQYLAADLWMPTWRAGLSLGRWRRDANYRFLNPLPPKREDLSLWASFRGGMSLGVMDVLVEFTNGVRLNHLYQAYELNTPDGRTEGVDLLNRSLAVTLMPRMPRVVR